jgi:hypothetical protein
MTAKPITVVAAGVLRSYQAPFPGGRWLTQEHTREIEAVSPDISLVHTTERELLNDQLPEQKADVLLIEA